MSRNNKEFKQMLLCGLDYSGKTTLIKRYSEELEDFYNSQNSLIKKVTASNTEVNTN